MNTFNGIGTTIFGKTDIRQDGSFVATKWFILLLLPIIPLGSYRVHAVSNTAYINPLYSLVGFFGSKKQFILEKVNLNKKQVLRTYLFSYGILGAFALFIYLITRIPDSAWNTILQYPIFIIIGLMLFALAIFYFFRNIIH